MNQDSKNSQNHYSETTKSEKTRVMLAWSNGKETHLHPSMMYMVENEHLKRLELLEQLEKRQSHGPEHYCRRLSSEYERYSDELWQLGLRVESYKMLLNASEVLLDTGRRWVNHRHTSWYHENLIHFRRLFRRCRQRAEQDSRFVPLFNASAVKQIYDNMQEEYSSCNISDRIKIMDWTLWDDIYHLDGDDPLCD